ncbi:peptidoglycan-recognition protein LE-like isoform X2 [Zophobas morio]|uniref:peptidoglycan-recognition protein LE-like isoform X2 n=1 Tax=Zophobas morio TaxID=2755281 RepID=UPI0030832BC3
MQPKMKTMIGKFSQGNTQDDERIQIEVRNSGSATSTNSKRSKDFRILNFLQKHTALLLVCFLILMMVLLLVAIVLLIIRQNNVSSQCTIENFHPKETSTNPTSPVGPPSETSGLTTSRPGSFELVSRQEWSAETPKAPPAHLQTPVPYVLILHTGTENCYTPKQCVQRVRLIQTFHMENQNWEDIGYNFLSGGDGRAYEGRGWKNRGPETYGYPDESVRIAFTGIFNTTIPSDRQLTACKNLIKKGVEKGYINKDYKLIAAAHLQKIHAEESQTKTLYDELKSWEHWTNPEELYMFKNVESSN